MCAELYPVVLSAVCTIQFTMLKIYRPPRTCEHPKKKRKYSIVVFFLSFSFSSLRSVWFDIRFTFFFLHFVEFKCIDAAFILYFKIEFLFGRTRIAQWRQNKKHAKDQSEPSKFLIFFSRSFVSVLPLHCRRGWMVASVRVSSQLSIGEHSTEHTYNGRFQHSNSRFHFFFFLRTVSKCHGNKCVTYCVRFVQAVHVPRQQKRWSPANNIRSENGRNPNASSVCSETVSMRGFHSKSAIH